MSREKQSEEQVILEIADDVRRIRESYFGQADYLFAKKLFEDGYRKQSEWISVDERLPERAGMYLGCTYKGVMMIAPFYPVYANDTPQFRYDIIYWMPLPEAPKMKGGEGDA